MNKYERINQLVSHLYKDKTGILKSYEAVDIPMHENYFSSGYGEILFDAIPILLSYYEFCEEDTLLDLGSGQHRQQQRRRALAQVARLQQRPVVVLVTVLVVLHHRPGL